MALRSAAHDPVEVLQWHRLDDRLTTSGQPSEEQLAAIADLGVHHVINLGPHEHEKAMPDERASVEALGITYTYIPVDFERPAEADFTRFCEAMRAAGDEKVHVHCIANLRVSAFLYRYRRDVLNVEPATALAEMDRLWRPGGAWAALIGHVDESDLPTRYAGHHY
ncbi:MAG TPA: protein tyrosine phosphatase family protein [Novosphingobium sp.]|nr:protein tyrosine phosphatase family protein [Novosphingobium sp.]